MAVQLVPLDAVKASLPIRAGNTEFDSRLRDLIGVASRQIERATRREFDKRERVERINTRATTRRVLDLYGNSDGEESFNDMGLGTSVREQIVTLKALPIDESATIEVRYDPTRAFGADTIVDPANYEVDAENGRLFLRYGTRRTVQGLQVTYTAGYDTEQFIAVNPSTTFDAANKAATITLAGANLVATTGTVTDVGSVLTAHHNDAGKLYFEITTASEHVRVGFATPGMPTASGLGETADSWAFDTEDGQTYVGGIGTAYGNHAHAGAIVGVALDLDNDAAWFSINGVWQGGATLAEIEAGTTTNAAFIGLLTGMKFVGVGDASGTGAISATANFGASPFFGAVPNGFVSGFGPSFKSPIVTVKDSAEEIRLAAIIQTVFLWKKLDSENVGSKQDKKQGQPNTDFLKVAGLTPEAASLLVAYKTIVKGYA